ncbi:NAD(P)-dependent oxidoreductase, partial [Streptomyces sp. CSDS2]|nr:NAD(P)-dependent oxidoreductase [Streptomyces sp. CSDS2]
MGAGAGAAGRAAPRAARPRTARLDRADGDALAALVGDGCELLVDVVAYDAGHARQLTSLA